MTGAEFELNSYGVVVRFEQRANHAKERERKRTDMEFYFDGRSMANYYTVPNTLISSTDVRVLSTSPMKCGMQHRISRTTSITDLARNKNHEFVPLVAESLGGL
jgi:hypothetical protein